MRPYVCRECKRAFSRQDALARHEKLHARKEYSQCPSPPASHISRQSVPSPGSAGHLCVGSDTAAHSSPTSGSVADQGEKDEIPNAPLSADIDFDLIWPDSEALLENIISLESTNQWQPSLGALPLSLDASFFGDNHFHDKASSIGIIPIGESHQAVHNVSEMVTKQVHIPPFIQLAVLITDY